MSDTDLPEAIDTIRPAVVQIGMSAIPTAEERARGEGAFYRATLGTGFFLSEDAIVATALHVVTLAKDVEEGLNFADKRLVVRLALPNTESMRANFTELRADVIAEDSRHDLALLRVRANPFRGEVGSAIRMNDTDVALPAKVATLDRQRPRDGTHIAVSGYPLSESVLITNAGYIASGWPFDLSDERADEVLPVPNIADTYLADAQANPGNSGGPVYSVSDASVIGMCVAGKGAPTWWSDNGEAVLIDGRQIMFAARLSLVVPSKYVIALASTVGVTCDVAASAS